MSVLEGFRQKRVLVRFAVAALCLLLCSCSSVPVAEDISQSQANEIVAVLTQNGIYATASKASGGRGKYSVDVKRSFYSQAVSLLHEKGLPGEHKPTFNEMVAQNGIIPNSREIDALKLDHALATEIEEMLQNHPGISSARAIVRLNFLKASQDPAVSVVIQQRPGMTIEAASISPLIVRIVPGVKDENVSVSIAPAIVTAGEAINEGVLNDSGRIVRVPLAPFLFFWRIPEDDYAHIALVLVALLAIIAVVGAIFGYWFGYYQQSKQYFDTTLPEIVPRASAKYERVRREGRSGEDGGPVQG